MLDFGCRLGLALTAALGVAGCWDPPDEGADADASRRRLARDFQVGLLECAPSVEVGPEPSVGLEPGQVNWAGYVPWPAERRNFNRFVGPDLRIDSCFVERQAAASNPSLVAADLEAGILAYREGRFIDARELLASVRDETNDDVERTQAIYWLFYVERDGSACRNPRK